MSAQVQCKGNELTTESAIHTLSTIVKNPSVGLPESVFTFISSVTPLVNVDLLIKDETGRTLLSWRDDTYAGTGWHIPGGIVRFKETLETRVEKVAEQEIGIPLQYEPVPIAFHQAIYQERGIRGHFISFLFKCSLTKRFTPENDGLSPGERGYLKWHDCCPSNLVPVHEFYREFITGADNGNHNCVER